MPLPEDWRAFIESLNSSGVDYLVVGAVALAHHGFPRYTGDLDVLVGNSPDNAQRLESALAEFGFASLGLKAADFVDSYRVVQLGVPPGRIDLLTSITGVTFDEAWAGRVEVVLGKTRVSFIGREALIQNKRKTGRAKDQADLEALGVGEEQ
ncbi:MAG: nucleotidyltransferase [Terriglobia bacterium]